MCEARHSDIVEEAVDDRTSNEVHRQPKRAVEHQLEPQLTVEHAKREPLPFRSSSLEQTALALVGQETELQLRVLVGKPGAREFI